MLRMRDDDVTWQEVDGHVVVLDLRTSMYLELNPSAAVLFNALKEGVEEGELRTLLQGTYGLSESQARQDVAAFVRQLTQQGLLTET